MIKVQQSKEGLSNSTNTHRSTTNSIFNNSKKDSRTNHHPKKKFKNRHSRKRNKSSSYTPNNLYK